jgi:hypothetical protein
VNDTRDHIAMIETPERWPVWPVLPVKNPSRYPEHSTKDHGVMIAHERVYSPSGLLYCVFHLNMFNIPRMNGYVDLDTMLSGSYEQFPSAEAIVDAGWIVD